MGVGEPRVASGQPPYSASTTGAGSAPTILVVSRLTVRTLRSSESG